MTWQCGCGHPLVCPNGDPSEPPFHCEVEDCACDQCRRTEPWPQDDPKPKADPCPFCEGTGVLLGAAADRGNPVCDMCGGSGKRRPALLYPEHVKLRALKTQTQAIGEFLEWLDTKKEIDLRWRANGTSVLQSFETLIAEYFEIDLKKLEEEKRLMVAELHAKGIT